MCTNGTYVSRQLSLDSTCVETRTIPLTANQTKTYNDCCSTLRQNGLIGGMRYQNFFQKLLTGLKTDEAIRITEEEVAKGNSVIISIVNTAEALDKRGNLNTGENAPSFAGQGDLPYEWVEEFLSIIGRANMPCNPLDHILQYFGHENVAELTGRSKRFVMNEDGTYVWQVKPNINEEAKQFCNGQKHIGILSRAGGVGISLHDAKDGRPRTHIILEIPWSAEDLTQQMGRTHRTDSRTSPHYILLITDVPAELRFTDSITTKMASMGALVRGDRRCCQITKKQAPKWSCATKRSTGLLFAYCLHSDTQMSPCSKDQRFPSPVTREYALHSLHIRDPIADNLLKPRLTDMFVKLSIQEDQEDQENQNIQKQTRLSLVRNAIISANRLYPCDVSMLCVKWSPSTHKYFPAQIRSVVYTTIACHTLLGDYGF